MEPTNGLLQNICRYPSTDLQATLLSFRDHMFHHHLVEQPLSVGDPVLLTLALKTLKLFHNFGCCNFWLFSDIITEVVIFKRF